jgi:transcription elongation GreA/GreB family factor
MSRAFVKEDDAGPGIEELPDRPIPPGANLVTARGLALIEAALADARTAQHAARAANDQAALAHAVRDLRYWVARQSAAQVMPPPDGAEVVQFGAAVAITRTDGRQQRFRIVGHDESDPAQGLLSHAAPLVTLPPGVPSV